MKFSFQRLCKQYLYIHLILYSHNLYSFVSEDVHIPEHKSIHSTVASLGRPNDISGLYHVLNPLPDKITQFESDLTQFEEDIVDFEHQITLLTEIIPPLATKEDLTSATNNTSYLGQTLHNMQGSSFTPTTDNLHIMAQNIANLQSSVTLLINLFADPIALVNMTKNNIALTTIVTSSSTAPGASTYLTTYNNAIGTALILINIATNPSTQSRINTTYAINAVMTAQHAWKNLNNAWIANGQGALDRPSSISSAVEIQTALSQLLQSLYILQQQQS